MVYDRWPKILSPRSSRFTPSGASRSGGRTLNGSVRVTSWQAGGVWKGGLYQIPLVTPDKILLAEMMEAILDGGAEPLAVPRLPGLRAPGSYGRFEAVPHSDASSFSDESLYGGSEIGGQVTVAAALFDTRLSFSWAGPSHLLGGDFEVSAPEGPRMHRIKRFLVRSGVPGAFVYEIEIAPPLRCDLAAGAEMNFADPHCLMRLSNADAIAATLEVNRYGVLDAEFVEA